MLIITTVMMMRNTPYTMARPTLKLFMAPVMATVTGVVLGVYISTDMVYSPTKATKLSMAADRIEGAKIGTSTRKKVLSQLAPRLREASSMELCNW